MTYSLPKDLAEMHNVSLKTIYNYMNKHATRIRTKRSDWKTFVHSEDFENVLQKVQSPFITNTESEPVITVIEENQSTEIVDSNLQNEMYELISVNNQLVSLNENLKSQIKQYWEYYEVEKEEKKEWQNKYEQLVGKLSGKLEEFADYKTKQTSKYYVMLSITVILMILLMISSFAAFVNLAE